MTTIRTIQTTSYEVTLDSGRVIPLTEEELAAIVKLGSKSEEIFATIRYMGHNTTYLLSATEGLTTAVYPNTDLSAIGTTRDKKYYICQCGW